MARETTIILLFLITIIGYSQLQQLPRCAFSRLDMLQCQYNNPGIRRAGENEYSVHSTGIVSSTTSTGSIICTVRATGQIIEPLLLYNNNPNVKFIFSPGFLTGENYPPEILAEYRVSCQPNQEIYYTFTQLNMQPKDCFINGVEECSDYILIDRGVFGMTELCGNFTSNPQSTLSGTISSNNMTIIFRSDTDPRTYPGFQMLVACYLPRFCNIEECLLRRQSTSEECVSLCNRQSLGSESISVSSFTTSVEPTLPVSVTTSSSTSKFAYKETVHPTPSSSLMNESTMRDETPGILPPPIAAAVGASSLAVTTIPPVFIIGICFCVRRRRRKKEKQMETLGPSITPDEKKTQNGSGDGYYDTVQAKVDGPMEGAIDDNNQFILKPLSPNAQNKLRDQLPEEPPQLDQDLTEVQQLKRDLLKKKMLFSRNQLQFGNIIGEGESGLVYRGYIKNGQPVAIKTARAFTSAIDKRKLLREVSIMMSFKHPNVMSLIGMCFDDEVPLVIMPFMSDGSVLDYVRQNRKHLYFSDQHDTEEMFAARKKCLDMCHQIAKGMSYLAQQRFVHRDLAARNCMIDGLTEGVIKVADFGLTEDMYGTNYYRRSASEGQERVPLRWMAPESIESNYYDETTDVWSFGVTCWEILTCGGVPYAGMPAMTLLTELHSGHRIDRPSNTVCSDEIWDLINSCWASVPKERPTFEDLVLKLYELLDFGTSYLKLQ